MMFIPTKNPTFYIVGVTKFWPGGWGLGGSYIHKGKGKNWKLLYGDDEREGERSRERERERG